MRFYVVIVLDFVAAVVVTINGGECLISKVQVFDL